MFMIVNTREDDSAVAIPIISLPNTVLVVAALGQGAPVQFPGDSWCGVARHLAVDKLPSLHMMVLWVREGTEGWQVNSEWWKVLQYLPDKA